ncbi:MAG: MFS transporter [Rhodospirillales bacterium]|nr:MFS transporter [Rhodospirillales bacterium]
MEHSPRREGGGRDGESGEAETAAAAEGADGRALWSWCFYDWANSGFPTVVVTYVFSAYFAKVIAADEVTGTSLWAYAMSLSGLAIAVASPILGAIADQSGRRKPWVGAFTMLCVAGSAALWWVVPGMERVAFALAVAATANFAFEMAIVYYNAMLPGLVPANRLGRLSGWGWGLGYLGGLTCLGLSLLLVMPKPPLLGMDAATYEPVRATAVLVAGWYAVFALPLFLYVPDTPATGVPPIRAIRRGLSALWATIKQVRRFRQVAIYLLAHMIYADGLNTLFALGGLYLAVTFGMDFDEILLFGICMNLAAAAGAFAFGWVDDWIGPKRTILIALGSMFVIGLGLVLAETRTMLWALAIPLGLFFGPAQAASRSLMARLAPRHLVAEFFGLYALSGKATAFVGPALFGMVTSMTGSQRWGMSTILLFIAAGALLLLAVKEPGRSISKAS